MSLRFVFFKQPGFSQFRQYSDFGYPLVGDAERVAMDCQKAYPDAGVIILKEEGEVMKETVVTTKVRWYAGGQEV